MVPAKDLIFAGRVKWFAQSNEPQVDKRGNIKRNPDGSVKTKVYPASQFRIVIRVGESLKKYTLQKNGHWKTDKEDPIDPERMGRIIGVAAYSRMMTIDFKDATPSADFKKMMESHVPAYFKECEKYGIAVGIGYKGKKVDPINWDRVLSR